VSEEDAGSVIFFSYARDDVRWLNVVRPVVEQLQLIGWPMRSRPS